MRRKLFGVFGAVGIAALAIGAVANSPYYALPAWSQKIACAVGNCSRFVELADWNSEAILDRETGLVWQRTPSFRLLEVDQRDIWAAAVIQCRNASDGGRLGWRLPTISELQSLLVVDPLTGDTGLPPGHPFRNIHMDSADGYWSATPATTDASFVYLAGFEPGASLFAKRADQFYRFICVRGGLAD